MYKFLTTKGVSTAFLIGTALSVITILLAIFGVGGIDKGLSEEATKEAMYQGTFFDFGLYASYFLVIASILVTLGFVVYSMINNFEAVKKSLFIAVGVAVLFIVCWLILGKNGYSAEQLAEMGITEGISKLISGMLITSYFLTFASIIALIGAEVYSSMKK
jgi:hypothetical protein